MAVFRLQKSKWDSLSDEQLAALRFVGGDLILGEPATAIDSSGNELVVFSDDRFTEFRVRVLKFVLNHIDSFPTDTGTFEEILSGTPDAGFTEPWKTGTSYSVGDQVLASDPDIGEDGGQRIWECIQAHTSQSDWQPHQVPALWSKPGGQSSEWEAGTAYAVDDVVTYNGTTYSCIQAHTSQVGWEPPNVPALWGVV